MDSLGKVHQHCGETLDHLRPCGCRSQPARLRFLEINVLVTRDEVCQDAVAVVVSLYRQQSVVELSSQRRDLRCKLSRRPMSAQLSALHAAAAIDHLSARVVAVCASACGIATNDVFASS